MKKILLLFVLFILISCKKNINTNESNGSVNNQEVLGSIGDDISSSDCGFDDGSYSATVDYNNSETGYSATYTLDVDIEDCQVVQINFPNDGYLDESHITITDIDEDGNASVDGEDGKTYEISIDN